MKTCTLKVTRPDREETEYFWKLYRAADRNDSRWCRGSFIDDIAEELSTTNLDRNQKLFLLRAWQVLVDDRGGFGRFMSSFDTYVHNMQDPDDDCVAWKPELSKLLSDGEVLDVLIEAYQEARQRIADLVDQTVTLPPLNDDLVAILGRPNFTCAHLAELLRKTGADIRRKSEFEQAAVIHWFLGLYLEHGDKWEGVAKADIQSRAAAAGIGKGE